MIRLLDISDDPVFIEAVFTPEVANYAITSPYFTDEFQGRRYALGNEAMLLIDPEARFAKIEAIFPASTELALCSYAPTLTTRTGMPRLEVLSKAFAVHVQLHLPGFTLWVVPDKVIDLRLDVHSGIVSFLFAGMELVGVTAHTSTIVE